MVLSLKVIVANTRNIQGLYIYISLSDEMKCNDFSILMLFFFYLATYLRMSADGEWMYPDNQLGHFPNSDEKYQKVPWMRLSWYNS